MSLTQIDYDNKRSGFWIHEGHMEKISHYIARAFEELGLENKEEWYIELYEDFDMAGKAIKRSWLVFSFEDYLGFDPAKEQALIQVLEKTKQNIQAKGEEISKHELNEIEANALQPRVLGDLQKVIKTKDIIHVLDIMIKMFKHEWPESDYRVYFEGFDKPDEPLA